MNSKLLKEILIGLLLVALQALLFNKIIILNGVMASVYVLFILRLPHRMNPSLVLLMALCIGGLVDVVLYSGGVHASAAITMALIRKPFLRGLLGKDVDGDGYPSISTKGLPWFITYSAVLIAIHQFWLFSVETMFNTSFWFFISRFFLSTLLSLVFVVLFDGILNQPKAKRL